MTRRRGVLSRSSRLVQLLLTASAMLVLSELSAMGVAAAETVEIPGEPIKMMMMWKGAACCWTDRSSAAASVQ